MMINNELITYLEELARLRLSDAERANAKLQLGEILGYINKLEELDTSGVEALSHPFAFVGALRDDIQQESADRTLILQNAPDQKDGYFKVPKTVE